MERGRSSSHCTFVHQSLLNDEMAFVFNTILDNYCSQKDRIAISIKIFFCFKRVDKISHLAAETQGVVLSALESEAGFTY